MNKAPEIIDGLNDLLQKNYEAAKGFKEAASQMEEGEVHRFLTYKSKQRLRFAAAIRDEILLIGGTPVSKSSIPAKINRFWIELKTLASGQEAHGVLESCEYGEKNAIDQYEAFLKNTAVPISLRSRLINQQNEIAQTLVKIGHLEKIYE